MGFSIFDETDVVLRFGEWNGPGGTAQITLIPDMYKRYRVDAMACRNPDSVDHTIRFLIGQAGDSTTLGEVVVPAGSGVGSVAPVDCLAQFIHAPMDAIVIPTHGLFNAILLDAIVGTVEVDLTVTFGVV